MTSWSPSHTAWAGTEQAAAMVLAAAVAAFPELGACRCPGVPAGGGSGTVRRPPEGHSSGRTPPTEPEAGAARPESSNQNSCAAELLRSQHPAVLSVIFSSVLKAFFWLLEKREFFLCQPHHYSQKKKTPKKRFQSARLLQSLLSDCLWHSHAAKPPWGVSLVWLLLRRSPEDPGDPAGSHRIPP